MPHQLIEGLKEVHGHREDDGGVLFHPDLGQGLEVAQLQRGRLAPDDLGRLHQLLGRLELARGVDDLGPLLALGLRLLGHSALHRLGQLDVLDLDGRDLHPPWLGVLVDDDLEPLVDGLALGQQLVQGGLAEDRAQRRLGDLGSGVDIVQDLGHGTLRVDDAEVDHRDDLDRDVVAGDDLLGGDLEGDGAEVDLDQPVDAEGDDEEEPRPLERDQAAEPEDDPALVFLGDAHAGEEEDDQDQDDDPHDDRHESPSSGEKDSNYPRLFRACPGWSTLAPPPPVDCQGLARGVS